MKNTLRQIIEDKKAGKVSGIPSYCTSNEHVIAALMDQIKSDDRQILIEATANQVNQFGGYTGMKPADFKNFVYAIADRIGIAHDRIILGGDHLGPLTWQKLPEEEAMKNSVELVKLFVLAGFKKIHLDTSMRLADDDPNEMLTDETIAKRGAILYKACEEAFAKLKEKNPDEEHPVFIIGSEVPIPGGAQEEEDSVAVTKPEKVEETLRVYHKVFEEYGLKDAFEHIIGVVTQPGVEFGDDDVFYYNSDNAAALCKVMAEHKDVVMEGHSSDYQTKECLRAMVQDGIRILKVGPALTFGYREGLFALSYMEKEVVPEKDRANFIEVLEKHMMDNPDNWKKYYHGDEKTQELKRKYSLSDRSRYYMADDEINATIAKLYANIDAAFIPMGMLHQYMPVQYWKVCKGELEMKAEALAWDFVKEFANDYYYAVE